MKRFWTFTLGLVVLLLLIFFLVQALDLPFLAEDPRFMLSQKKWVAALLGIGLLIVDVVAPVPSSVIMFANGVMFGIVLGATFSTIGGMGAAIVAYWIGARGERAGKRWMGDESLSRAHVFFVKYGMMAVIVSRPLPILGEVIGIIAGMSKMPAAKFFTAAMAGILPTAILYAVAGKYSTNFQSGLYAFLAVMVLAGAVWFMGRTAVKGSHK
jgi:uncharacterized membrane protein YdjX (TVP38/TMEM64 family)